MDKLSDFFIIGVERGGTSSLHATLMQHPSLKEGRKWETCLYSQNPKKIKSFYNGLFIVLLRNPIWRAWSEYCVSQEKIGKPYNLRSKRKSIVKKGVYVNQLKKWFKHFQRDRFLIIRSEDYFTSPGNVVKKAQEFLGVEYKGLRDIYSDPLLFSKKKLTIPLPVFNFLKFFYKPYNKKLYDLLGRDMGWELKT